MFYPSKSLESSTFHVEEKIHKEAKCALAAGVAALLLLGVAGALMGCGKIVKFPVRPLCIAGYATAALGLAFFSLSLFCIQQACKSQKSYLTILENDSPPNHSFHNLDIDDLIALAHRSPSKEMIPYFVEKAKESPISLSQIPRDILTPFLQECAKLISDSSYNSDQPLFKDQYKIVQEIISHLYKGPLEELTKAPIKFWEKYTDQLLNQINQGHFNVENIQNRELKVQCLP